MKINKLHIAQQKMQKAIALFCGIWLIFSTCSMQTSLHHLLNDTPISIEQTTKTNKSKKQVTVTERSCHINLATDDNSNILQKAGWDISNPFVAILTFAFLVFFTGYRFKSDANNHPVYKDTSQLKGKLPLFIEFQNLRI